MSRFTDFFQEPTPAPAVEPAPVPVSEPFSEPVVEAPPASKKSLPKKKFTMD
jgi:hypothetical protein